MKSAKILAVIPARGGSKRLPRKNIKKLGGKPLIHYTIQACLKSSLITDHVFSTEDQQIKEIAISLGANAPFTRPLELAEDSVRNSETLTHALHFMENMKKIKYDALMLLQPTAPFRNEKHIDEAIRIFLQSGASSLASVRGPYKKREINLKKVNGDRLQNLIPQNEQYYIYNAAIYIILRENLLKTMQFTSSDEAFYIMDEKSSIDIDTHFEFKFAESFLEA